MRESSICWQECREFDDVTHSRLEVSSSILIASTAIIMCDLVNVYSYKVQIQCASSLKHMVSHCALREKNDARGISSVRLMQDLQQVVVFHRHGGLVVKASAS